MLLNPNAKECRLSCIFLYQFAPAFAFAANIDGPNFIFDNACDREVVIWPQKQIRAGRW